MRLTHPRLPSLIAHIRPKILSLMRQIAPMIECQSLGFRWLGEGLDEARWGGEDAFVCAGVVASGGV